MKRHLTIGLVLAGAVAWTTGCGEKKDGEEDTSVDTPEEDAAADLEEEDATAEDVEEEDGPTGILACELPTRTFWTWDLSVMPPANMQVEAECRGWGPNVAVYVPDDIWGTDIVGDDVVTIVETFEDATPADASRGILDILTAAFGAAPDVDADPRFVLLYFEMGSFMGRNFDGFFRADDEVAGSHSNMTEMLHLNGVLNPVAEPYMLSIVAHEMQHVIHFAADADEHAWVNESMSEAAMALCGYYTDEDNVAAFASSPDTTLVIADRPDYGAAFLFGAYLIDQFGEGFLLDLVEEPGNGIAGFDAAAAAEGVDFLTVFSDWVVANLLDDPTLDAGEWGYASYDPPDMGVSTNSPDGVVRTSTVSGWAADYLRYPLAGTGTEIDVHVESTSFASLGATLVTTSTSGTVAPQVTAISLLAATTDQTVTVPDGHDQATLVVFAVAEGTSFSYGHSALWP